MKNIVIIILTSILLCADASAQLADKILAVVNGEPITKTDVDEILAPIYLQYQSVYNGNELQQRLLAARKDILDQLIEDKLILQQARKENITVDKSEVDVLIDQVRANFKTEEEFAAALKSQNVTLSGLRNRYEEQLLIKRLIEMQVLRKINISPAEILEYYQTQQQSLQTPEQIRLRNIFIGVDAADPEQEKSAKEKINEIYAQLQQGTEFIELVEKFSEAPNVVDSGDMGFMQKGSLRPEIEDQVFNLPVGEFSKPIQTPLGFYIFKVEEKIPATVPDLETVKETIRQKLFQRKSEQVLTSWIDNLRKTSLIEVKHATEEKS